MKTLAKNTIIKNETVYMKVAKKFDTNIDYVSKINRGERTPKRGKGLKILNELKSLTQK